jgi:hypothetical protein
VNASATKGDAARRGSGNCSYLPLYFFCGEQLSCARLRTANQDAAAGTQAELTRIVSGLRAVWPQVQIVLRGDSGFCREAAERV